MKPLICLGTENHTHTGYIAPSTTSARVKKKKEGEKGIGEGFCGTHSCVLAGVGSLQKSFLFRVTALFVGIDVCFG